MLRRRVRRPTSAVVGLTVLITLASLAVGAPPAQAEPGTSFDPSMSRSYELTTSTRLADRRAFTIGSRFYEVGAEDGSYPATGFHTRGEMGGFWSMPIKLLDGLWFAADGKWLSAQSFTQGYGYTRQDLGTTSSGVHIYRTDFAPDGTRAGLVGLTFATPRRSSVAVTMDAHSELMSAYPWGETTPSQTTSNLADTGRVSGNNLVFRDTGNPPGANSRAHDWAAVVGSTATPTASALGTGYRGPVTNPVICPASGPDTAAPPIRCDDTAYGKGTGGQLQYQLDVRAGFQTVWFSVAGSDQGQADALAQQQQALSRPFAALAAKVIGRFVSGSHTDVSLPGDPQLADAIRWSKQNLLDSRQQATDLQLRVTNAGTKYPAPSGQLAQADWIGAGWPDYPWIFGTDGEYTAFAAVAAGQFDAIEAHLRTLMSISDTVNQRSGKVVHEVVPDGSVYFGANSDDGNTDETVKFPSAVALVWRWTGDNAFRDQMYDFTVRNLRYATTVLDTDKDGWPEGAGNVEREGMGAEKLDNTVYTIRGLLDLADMANAKGDTATATWASTKAADLRSRFEAAWWVGGSTASYADSLTNPGNGQLFQRYWIGLTPAEAELPATGAGPAAPVGSIAHDRTTLAQHERPCYTGENGLFHTGTGATTDAKGNPGPTCDTTVSAAPSDREVFTLTTSIAAVGEAALGRMGPAQAVRYTDDIARVQMDPAVWEAPGMMPEIAPSPDFTANIDQPFYTRSSGIQAWGTYGVLWPVVHFELGIAPDLGRNAVGVVPQIPDGQSRIGANSVVLGNGSIDVTAQRDGGKLTTTVTRHQNSPTLTIGAVVPAGRTVVGATLDGQPVSAQQLTTARGLEVRVPAPAGSKRDTSTLVVNYR